MEENAIYPRYRWFILTVVCFIITLAYMNLMAYAPIMSQIAKDLGINVAATTHFLSGFHLASAFAFLFGGIVCDKFGVATALMVGLLLSTIPATLMPWLGHSYTPVFISRLIQGVSIGFIFVVVGPVTSLWFPKKEYGLAGGFLMGSVSIGAGIGVFLAPLILNAVESWQKTIAILSILGWIGIILTFFIRRKPIAPMAAEIMPQATNPEEKSLTFGKALHMPVSWIGGLILFLSTWTAHALYSLVPAYLAAPVPMGVGLGSVMAGKLSLALIFIGIFAIMTGGLFLDRVVKGNYRLTIALGFAVTCVFSFFITSNFIHQSLIMLLICLMITGFAAPFGAPAFNAFLATTYPRNIIGRMNGSMYVLGKLGSAAGIFIGGIAVARTGSFAAAIGTISIATILAVILTNFLKPPKQH